MKFFQPGIARIFRESVRFFSIQDPAGIFPARTHPDLRTQEDSKRKDGCRHDGKKPFSLTGIVQDGYTGDGQIV